MVLLKFHVQLKPWHALCLSVSLAFIEAVDADDTILKQFIEPIEIAIELITTLPMEWSKQSC